MKTKLNLKKNWNTKSVIIVKIYFKVFWGAVEKVQT